jgi:hypothetical protein
MKLATIDIDRAAIVRQDGKILVGDCNRCGECCKVSPPYPGEDGACIYLVKDQLVDGELVYRCDVYFKRPFGCALWPEVDDELPEECSLSWEEEG